ncbi:tetratricopeptide repeat protein [Nannocystaceae bacterium ST9]
MHRLALVLPLALITCKAGKAGEFVEPEQPSAGEAMRELECRPDQERAEPLVVDWPSDDRTDLEIAMRDGIVVASYDCDSFRVLEACRVRGGYEFAGVSRKQDVRQFTGLDELHANFPVGASKLAAGLEREASLDLALVTIGKHRTSAWRIARGELEGDCAEATHFVSSAIVGAFAMRTGTRGFVGSVAEIFLAGEQVGDVGGSSNHASQSLSRDGDLAACDAANPLDRQPPAQCQSLLRVELVGLVDAPVEPPGPSGELVSLTPTCAIGFVDVEGTCVVARAETPRRCEPADLADCTEQCEAGNADSCFNLAVAHVEGRGVERDRDRARELFDRSCTGGNSSACTQLALRLDWKTDAARVGELLGQTCEAGDALACRTYGQELIRGNRLGADMDRGERLLERSCELADPHGCPFWAAHLLNTKNDAAKAREVVQDDCERGNGRSCAFLGAWLSRCSAGAAPGMSSIESCQTFAEADEARATVAYERACRAGVFDVCGTAVERLADQPARAEVLRAIDAKSGE